MTRVAVVQAASIPFDCAATVAKAILYAEIDLAEITRGHLDMDAVGHYSRPDVFELRIDTRRRSPVVFSDSSPTPNPPAGIADGHER